MDGFWIWLATSLFLSWLAGKPASPPPVAPQPQPMKETVILLPNADGKSTGIVFKANGQETTVTEPYQGIESTGGKVVSKTFSAEEMQRLYPDVMQALPEKPRSFTLRFEENGTKLTAESAMMVEDIRQEILKRAVPEVTVIGHTDRVGSEEDNLRLSRARAEAIRDILIAGGVPAQIIQAIGLGELEPEVMTEDGVAEPRNRRVEISVR
jgi:outer membrane protein OmpA-like peptidoglycan-associated protein